MRELEQTRLRVLENEVEKFDLKVSDIQSEAVVAVNDFMEMHKDFSLSAESPPISINDCTTTGTSMCNPQNSNQISERICESCPAFSSVQGMYASKNRVYIHEKLYPLNSMHESYVLLMFILSC